MLGLSSTELFYSSYTFGWLTFNCGNGGNATRKKNTKSYLYIDILCLKHTHIYHLLIRIGFKTRFLNKMDLE